MSNKIKAALDTSALISLGCGDVLSCVFVAFDCWSTKRVEEELREIARIPDRFGAVARLILESDGVKFMQVEPKELGELEVVELAQDPEIEAVLMDDVAARRKLHHECKAPILFSPALVYYICLKEILSWEEGWNIIERMAVQRTWKDNIIYEAARMQWKKHDT